MGLRRALQGRGRRAARAGRTRSERVGRRGSELEGAIRGWGQAFQLVSGLRVSPGLRSASGPALLDRGRPAGRAGRARSERDGAARIRARGRHSRLGPRFPPRTKGSGVARTACVRAFSVRYLPGRLRNTSSYSAKAGAPICGKGMLGEKRSALVAAVAPPWIRPEGRIELARLLFRGGQGSPVSRLVP